VERAMQQEGGNLSIFHRPASCFRFHEITLLAGLHEKANTFSLYMLKLNKILRTDIPYFSE
jgi:hypothetical protein